MHWIDMPQADAEGFSGRPAVFLTVGSLLIVISFANARLGHPECEDTIPISIAGIGFALA